MWQCTYMYVDKNDMLESIYKLSRIWYDLNWVLMIGTKSQYCGNFNTPSWEDISFGSCYLWLKDWNMLKLYKIQGNYHPTLSLVKFNY